MWCRKTNRSPPRHDSDTRFSKAAGAHHAGGFRLLMQKTLTMPLAMAALLPLQVLADEDISGTYKLILEQRKIVDASYGWQHEREHARVRENEIGLSREESGEDARPHTHVPFRFYGLAMPGSVRTNSRNRSPRTSKLRY
jgi:hypothetical protein